MNMICAIVSMQNFTSLRILALLLINNINL